MISTFRWRIKKAARMGMALGSWVSGQAPSSATALDEPQVRVLTYHRFGDAARDPFCVASSDFDLQMRYLAEQGNVVSLADLRRFIDGEVVLPPSAVVVTIDDGFRSLYSKALPILRHYGIPAAAFITPGMMCSEGGGFPEKQIAPEEYLTWNELTAVANAGVTIGSHAWSHQSLGRMTSTEVADEAIRSREALEAHLGINVEAFAYPFGTLADFNAMTMRVLEHSGYCCAFTSQHGAVRSGADVFALPRVKVEGGEELWMFRLLVRGGLDNWRHIDRTLWRLQMSRSWSLL
ncbi:MAG TPA: polysaccharide deacetylase family protein [Burkholderiales bacterium]|nr:polysaccharide deacetylase family protein [Burkholderiales bacterium]